MATWQIPLDSSVPAYYFNVELDGTYYRLRFYWNSRDNAWYYSITETLSETEILHGRKVVANYNLLLGIAHTPVLGALVALDTSTAGEPPRRDDLGARVQLYYVDEADLG